MNDSIEGCDFRRNQDFLRFRKPEINLVIGPTEFLAMKAIIEAVMTFEGISALSAIASVLSRILLVFLIALFMARKTIIKAAAIIIKIIDQIITKIIRTISKAVMGIVYR